ncbi:2-succinyl-5-enolpyruvyl-6-hydroxy-3-cyclohexene-1-carboxylic-acid synthase [Geochorda subterranea]|uniref:2-succinyl-5-enolpyruvyl-6-hydroxy-3-cyclohexene-1-carboxylate synthase n=1 Tax=Geochorda subterranea TaxID=3109564 RepID=A0ABZ1BP09_9FIRM|nr:2-succinyl-5-enolpyruvyl-6-hydroxy-3-cyclohexene-1-carboxylic-acid synthase [Limnochorda sp. LNt]WRP14575.1 2-succinyl-5-enolpyruvyl-6-hydroxy-3-cyclohexene-1-carboxylic-acid synthase [Limnochorda sp. LNt]
MRPSEETWRYVDAFVQGLVDAGVRHICLAPGSRSTPLAVVLAARPELRLWPHVDERSCGFFALGLARALGGQPVAVACTSGTAAANLYPAVVEARYGRVPLVVLTADRPPELRGVGASQTIDQLGLYGSHVKWWVDAALPEATPPMLRYAAMLGARAARTAVAAPAGPVHLNFPFREPLLPQRPDGESAERQHAAGVVDPMASRASGAPSGVERTVDPATVERLVDALRSSARPLLVVGPQEDPALAAAAVRLARSLRAPLLADPLSQARWGRHELDAIIDAYDLLLRDEILAASLRPGLVLRMGAAPVSKALLAYLERHADVRQLVLDVPGGWRDPLLTGEPLWAADPAALLAHAAGRLEGSGAEAGRLEDRGEVAADPAWLARWKALQQAARGAVRRVLAAEASVSEPGAVVSLLRAMPDGATLYVGNSMPVRDLDAVGEADGRIVRVLANRGTSGIDGVVSAALGAAAGTRDGPVALIIGDLSFYHDLNGLLAARLHGLSLTVLLLHNDGGGIFSLLSQAQLPEADFERLFATPTGLDFRPAVEMYGGRWASAATPSQLERELQRALREGGLQVVEVRTDRRANARYHHRLWSEALEAARRAVAAP